SSPLELGAVPAAVTVAIEGVLGLPQRPCSWACRARRRSTSSRSARSSARRALFPASANTVVVPGRDAAGAALCVILNAGAVVDSGRLDTACPGSNEAVNVSRLKPRVSLLSASVACVYRRWWMQPMSRISLLAWPSGERACPRRQSPTHRPRLQRPSSAPRSTSRQQPTCLRSSLNPPILRARSASS
ncbi:hypothetical protein F444_16045, partial [Phytophthora nicotianae P1976]